MSFAENLWQQCERLESHFEQGQQQQHSEDQLELLEALASSFADLVAQLKQVHGLKSQAVRQEMKQWLSQDLIDIKAPLQWTQAQAFQAATRLAGWQACLRQ